MPVLLTLVAALGVAFVLIRVLRTGDRLAAVERQNEELRHRLASIERAVQALDPRPPAPPPATAPAAPPPYRRPAAEDNLPDTPRLPALGPAARPPGAPVPPPTPATLRDGPARSAPPPRVLPPEGAPLSDAAAWLTEFFTTGNVVAKVGIVVLFFGVAFLVRYTVDRGLLPVEYRLMGAAAGGMVLLVIGWRLRLSRREYAVVLQGGGIGVLYMTIFGAFRLYGLLPASMTFALLVAVVVLSAVLAVAQGDMSLAVVATSGGFLAPILVSTGGGSHVALFSYYAVLNAGVLGIAWFRAWRFLNWLAFVFTFGIGFIWGAQYYQPAFLWTTEPFLVGFFLLFVAVAVIFAHRQPPQLRGYIDGSLVFAAPGVAFGMQSVLVADVPFGRAYSAVVLSALYLALARWLWRDAALRVLAEAFLALAVVFLVLAVPCAFDGHGTAAVWALEGTAMVWIGLRQRRVLARLAGSATLIGAGVAFFLMQAPTVGGLPVLNARFLSGAAIAAGSILAARLLSRGRDALDEMESRLEWILLAWGLCWWFGTMLVEIEREVPERLLVSSALLGVAASGCVAGLYAWRRQWRAMTLATIAIGPLLWLPAIPLFIFGDSDGPLVNLGWLAWPSVLAMSYALAFWFERAWPSIVVGVWHAGAAWLLTFLAAWTSATAVRQLVPESTTWSSTVWCLVPAMLVVVCRRIEASPPRRLEGVRELYGGPIPGALVAVILAWVLWACTEAGSAAPLTYVPGLNPLELAQTAGLLVAYTWWKGLRANALIQLFGEGWLQPLMAGLAFLAVNAAVARSVHFYADVPFDLDALARSGVFHAGISILWAVTAWALMAQARRTLSRPVWMTGAALLAALIAKLFLVDLGRVGSVARIVSFLAAGILILAIGYFAPVPPRSERSA